MTIQAQPEPAVDAAMTQRAAHAVLLVAERLADPARVAAVAGAPDNREPIYETPMWEPMALSHGYPGVALFFGELAHRDARWAAAGHAHLTAAVEAMSRYPSHGLFFGPAAVAAAAQTSGGYRQLRRRLLAWVADNQAARTAAHAERRRAGGRGVPWDAYDVINGLSGVGRLLLDAVDDEAVDRQRAADALTGTLRHLVGVCEPIEVDGVRVPGWWVPPELEPVEEDRRDYPRGDFNLGMAHGMAGPLALFALAAERGWTVPGGRDAALLIGGWLAEWTLSDSAGPYWPCRVGWDDQVAPVRPAEVFSRTAWCYGAPGVAAALYRAGAVFDVPAWQELALESLRAALRREESEWRLVGPTVCHGYAGLLQVLHRLGTAAADPVLLGGVRRMVARVLDHVDEDAPFVFRHVMRDSGGRRHVNPRQRELDVAGVLEGAAGTACALLSVVPDELLTGSGAAARPVRQWDRVLMLA